MGLLDQVISFLRAPVEQFRDAVCEENPRSNSCSTLTSLAQSMGGETPQRLTAISTFRPQPLVQTPAPQTLTGCFLQMHVVPMRRLEALRNPVQISSTRRLDLRPQTVTGCYIEMHTYTPIDRATLRGELERLRRPHH